jgi:hypothetical protein
VNDMDQIKTKELIGSVWIGDFIEVDAHTPHESVHGLVFGMNDTVMVIKGADGFMNPISYSRIMWHSKMKCNNSICDQLATKSGFCKSCQTAMDDDQF